MKRAFSQFRSCSLTISRAALSRSTLRKETYARMAACNWWGVFYYFFFPSGTLRTGAGRPIGFAPLHNHNATCFLRRVQRNFLLLSVRLGCLSFSSSIGGLLFVRSQGVGVVEHNSAFLSPSPFSL